MLANPKQRLFGIHAKGYTEPHGKDRKPQKSYDFGRLASRPAPSANESGGAIEHSLGPLKETLNFFGLAAQNLKSTPYGINVRFTS